MCTPEFDSKYGYAIIELASKTKPLAIRIIEINGQGQAIVFKPNTWLTRPSYHLTTVDELLKSLSTYFKDIKFLGYEFTCKYLHNYIRLDSSVRQITLEEITQTT